jgi:hypothetical protein
VYVGEALDVFAEGLSWLLLDPPQVAYHWSAVSGPLEVGDEPLAQLIPGRD